jgi:hypothetical protein
MKIIKSLLYFPEFTEKKISSSIYPNMALRVKTINGNFILLSGDAKIMKDLAYFFLFGGVGLNPH